MQPDSPYQPTPQTPHYVDHTGIQHPTAPLQTPVYGEQPGAPQPHEYAFIMNPGKTPAKKGLPGGNSLPVKLLYGAGLLLVVVILLAIGKSVLGGGSGSYQELFVVASDQQELIHLATNATSQRTLSVNTVNFTYTAQLGITSAQHDTIVYLATNKHKIKPKQLALKVSAKTDAQLKAAASADTYEETYQQVMNTKLATYEQDLKRAYGVAKGPKGKALLAAQYKQADLLRKQLAGN